MASLALLLVGGLLLVAVLVAGQQARAAADLGALAAAGAVVEGRGAGSACSVAGQVAQDNGGQLVGCETTESAGEPWPRVQVTVARAVAGTAWTVTARSSAGAVPDRDAVGAIPDRDAAGAIPDRDAAGSR